MYIGCYWLPQMCWEMESMAIAMVMNQTDLVQRNAFSSIWKLVENLKFVLKFSQKSQHKHCLRESKEIRT